MYGSSARTIYVRFGRPLALLTALAEHGFPLKPGKRTKFCIPLGPYDNLKTGKSCARLCEC